MPSADFCPAVRPPFDSLSRRSDAEQISWRKFSRLLCTAAESTLRTFDPCFFQTPPRSGSPCIITRPSPPSGWPEDLHLQTAEHAQHTTKPLRGKKELFRVFVCQGDCATTVDLARRRREPGGSSAAGAPRYHQGSERYQCRATAHPPSSSETFPSVSDQYP